MSGFPADHCRVLTSVVKGNAAFVVLDTGSAENRYLYAGTAERIAGGWIDGVSSNGPSAGWTRTGREGDRGIAYIYDEAPSGADRVQAALGDDVREVPVLNGVYLATWWGVPASEEATPGLVAFRVAGAWVSGARLP
jgi:hypothetical protein